MTAITFLNEYLSTDMIFKIEEKLICKAKSIMLGRMKKKPISLTSSKLTKDFVSLYLSAKEREVFFCIYLDNQHRAIHTEVLFEGTIDSSMVHPREVLKAALKVNAAAIIFTHNHPSGVAEPSQADVSITKRLKAALELVDIRVLDHLVVGDGEVTSMAERGLI